MTIMDKLNAPIRNPVTGKTMKSATAATLYCARCKRKPLAVLKYTVQTSKGAYRAQVTYLAEPRDRSSGVRSIGSSILSQGTERSAWCRSHGSVQMPTTELLAAIEDHRKSGRLAELFI